jgi:hypothetical protein
VFDVMVLAGEDIMGQPTITQRHRLQKLMVELDEPVRESPVLDGEPAGFDSVGQSAR